MTIKHSDCVWFTSANPRSESPSAIIDDMLSGLSATQNVRAVVDRREALTSAIESAAPDDLVLVAGKGHESYQEVNGDRHRFSDRVVALSVLREH